jgi:hypothetical protein
MAQKIIDITNTCRVSTDTWAKYHISTFVATFFNKVNNHFMKSTRNRIAVIIQRDHTHPADKTLLASKKKSKALPVHEKKNKYLYKKTAVARDHHFMMTTIRWEYLHQYSPYQSIYLS